MVNNHRALGVILLLLAGIFMLPAANAETPADIRILVDISGSMKQTDPNNLRVPAVNLLTELIPDDATAGIWTFGRYVNNVLPSAKVDKQWRQHAKSQAKAISSVGLFTNLTGALNDASWNIAANDGVEHSIILLTDGYIDMPGNAQTNPEQKQILLRQVLPKLVNTNTKVHTLALSNDVDKELLQQLSAATGGLYLEAQDAGELSRLFLKAFDRAVTTEQVPLINNRFNIDTTVQEFTALVFHASGAAKTKLIAPSGKVFTVSSEVKPGQIRWYQDIGFEIITVTAPEAGQWQIDAAQDPDNRVQVLTDMKLQVSGIPATIFAGNPLNMSATLTEQGQALTIPELLRTTEIKLRVTAPDGRTGSKVLSNAEKPPSQGVYHETFQHLLIEGEYQFVVTAIGKTFERRQVLTATLLAPLKLRSQKLLDKEQFLVALSPDTNVDVPLTRVSASITAPNGGSLLRELSYNSSSHLWELYLTADKGPGNYQIDLTGRIVLQGGTEIGYNPEALNVTFPLGLAVSAAALAAPESVDTPPNSGAVALPNLAIQYEQQQAALAAAQAPEPEPGVEPIVVDVAEEQPSLSVWWYLGIGGGALVLFSGLAYWVLTNRKKKSVEPVPVAPPVEAAPAPSAAEETSEVPEDLIQEDIPLEPATEAIELGDFDSFDGEQEIEIPLPGDESGAGQRMSVTATDANLPNNDKTESMFDESFDAAFDEPNDQTLIDKFDEDFAIDTDLDDPDAPTKKP